MTGYFFNFFFSPSKIHFRRKSELPDETPEELLRLPGVGRSYVAVNIIVINIKLIVLRKNHKMLFQKLKAISLKRSEKQYISRLQTKKTTDAKDF